MILYNVYVPLRLQLSKNVEENSGSNLRSCELKQHLFQLILVKNIRLNLMINYADNQYVAKKLTAIICIYITNIGIYLTWTVFCTMQLFV